MVFFGLIILKLTPVSGIGITGILACSPRCSHNWSLIIVRQECLTYPLKGFRESRKKFGGIFGFLYSSSFSSLNRSQVRKDRTIAF